MKVFSLFNIPGVSHLQVLASKLDLTCRMEFCAVVNNFSWLTFVIKNSVLDVRGFIDSFLNLHLILSLISVKELGFESTQCIKLHSFYSLAKWLNVVYELSGCGFESCCSHSIYAPSYLFGSPIMTIT